ncbi:hypothetical protein ACVWZW_009048 [Bradyrhizobium sp. F1.13.4]
MNHQAKSNIYNLNQDDPRFDFESAGRFLDVLRGNAAMELQFRALPESKEAKKSAGAIISRRGLKEAPELFRFAA